MKKYSILSIGILFLVLTVGGIAFAEGGMSGSSDQSSGSSMGTSSDQSGMDQSGTSGTGSSSDQSGMSSGSSTGTSGTGSMSQAQVDINTASVKELESVPGMSKSMARNIVKYRDQNGPFSSVDDLTKVKGISEKKLNAMRHGLTVGAAGSAAPSSGAQQGTSGMGPESSGAGGTGGMGSGDMGTGSSGSSGTSGSESSSGSSGY